MQESWRGCDSRERSHPCESEGLPDPVVPPGRHLEDPLTCVRPIHWAHPVVEFFLRHGPFLEFLDCRISDDRDHPSVILSPSSGPLGTRQLSTLVGLGLEFLILHILWLRLRVRVILVGFLLRRFFFFDHRGSRCLPWTTSRPFSRWCSWRAGIIGILQDYLLHFQVSFARLPTWFDVLGIDGCTSFVLSAWSPN